MQDRLVDIAALPGGRQVDARTQQLLRIEAPDVEFIGRAQSREVVVPSLQRDKFGSAVEEPKI